MKIVFSWPPKELSPNARCHWSVKARAVKGYRNTWFVLAKQAKLKADWEGPINIRVTCHPPKNWAFGDIDNLTARLKSGFDGLADALKVNDTRFVPQILISSLRTSSIEIEIFQS